MEWRPIKTAPRNGTRIKVLMATGAVFRRAFYAVVPFENMVPDWGGTWYAVMKLEGRKTYVPIVKPKFWKPRKKKKHGH